MQKKQLTLEKIAELTGSKLVGDPTKLISHVADLENASSDDASFLSNPLYEKALSSSKAGVIFVNHSLKLTSNQNFLVSENPSRAFQQLVELFFENQTLTGFEGIHRSAVIHETVKLGKNVKIGPLCVLDEHVVIGDNTQIGAHCTIGPKTTIGENCFFHPRVTIRENCIIGNRVVLQPGAVIGSCGFGFTTDNRGNHTKLNQIGNVIIEDDVEIGANTTIDRARFKSTIIGKGTKIDNLVQIAHGVIIGAHNIIVAQTGIAGSSETGNYVVIGGQAAINGHIKISKGAMIAARTGVLRDILEPGKYGGYPAMPISQFHRTQVHLLKIGTYVKEIQELKKEIEKLKTPRSTR